jgi:ParB family transcriptional regulator, chromosome partitioning protein
MASAVQKITLSSSRDIRFSKLVLSQSNIRGVKAVAKVQVSGRRSPSST